MPSNRKSIIEINKASLTEQREQIRQDQKKPTFIISTGNYRHIKRKSNVFGGRKKAVDKPSNGLALMTSCNAHETL